MGDMGEVFNDLRKIKQAKRASNTPDSTAMLRAAGILFRAYNGGVHLKLLAGDKLVNFWPSTGLWMVEGNTRKSRGVRKLINYVKANTEGAKG